MLRRFLDDLELLHEATDALQTDDEALKAGRPNGAVAGLGWCSAPGPEPCSAGGGQAVAAVSPIGDVSERRRSSSDRWTRICGSAAIQRETVLGVT